MKNESFIWNKLIECQNQILKELENFKVAEIPENLVEEEVKILSNGMKEEEIKKNKKN